MGFFGVVVLVSLIFLVDGFNSYVPTDIFSRFFAGSVIVLGVKIVLITWVLDSVLWVFHCMLWLLPLGWAGYVYSWNDGEAKPS